MVLGSVRKVVCGSFLRQHLPKDIVPYIQEGWSWLLHALYIKASVNRAAPTDKYRGVSLKVLCKANHFE